MREPLAGVTVRLDGTPAPGSTTITPAGGAVLVLATALPTQAFTLTSTYLLRSDGAIAVSHLKVTAHEETFTQTVIGPGQLHATLAGACLLDHAAALRDLIAQTTSATVAVDVDPQALQRVTDTWGPPSPPR